MWKVDKNGTNIIDPEGKVYIPGDMINIPAIGETLEVKSNKENNNFALLDNSNLSNWNEMIVSMLNAKNTKNNLDIPEDSPRLAIIYIKKIDEEYAQLTEFFSDGSAVTSNRFKLPRGLKGEKGDAGAKGLDGEKGEKGDAGDSLWVINEDEIKPNTTNPKILSFISGIRRATDILDISEIATKNNLIHKLNTEHAYDHYNTYEVNSNKFVFEDYNQDYWHYFYVYFQNGSFKIVNSIEIPSDLDPQYVFSNVSLDYSITSSNNIMFNPNNKTLTITKWDKVNVKIDKVAVYRKLKI